MTAVDENLDRDATERVHLAVSDLPLSSFRAPPPDLRHPGEHARWWADRSERALTVA